MNTLSYLSPSIFMFAVHVAMVTFNNYLIDFLKVLALIAKDGDGP
jgi:hypothetical protein